MDKALESTLSLVIADDDTDDQYLMQKAIWELNSNHKITSVYNGLQLLDYLMRKGAYKNCIEPFPDCIFLDLNMPLVNGAEALNRIKKNPEINTIPIYIFSTSSSQDEKQKLITLGANGFYTKSPKPQNLKKTVMDILSEVNLIQKKGDNN